MSLHIKRFLDRLHALDAKGIKDFSCPMQDAKDLHRDITKLLLELEELHSNKDSESEVIKVELNGGNF